ncbi:MAG: DUF5655 domain-containing protein [Rickettsiales bacterium]|jgi:predicted transport protein|nr:DUF5655 domain-containing protein [Rickettsiales bacterium]
MAKGIVYIVRNPAFSHLIKIGLTTKSCVKDRGLDASNIPEDYDILYAYDCDNPEEIESHLHELFKIYRHYTITGRQTEFFYIGCLANAKTSLEMLKKAGNGVKDITEEFKDKIEDVPEATAVYDEEKVVNKYREKDHLISVPKNITKLYRQFKSAILKLSNGIEIIPRKLYIGFKLYADFKLKTNICDIQIQQKQLKIFINARKGTLDDPKHLCRDISETGHWGNGDYQIPVADNKNIDYIISLIKQVL